MKRTGLHMVLMRETRGLNLSQRSRPDTQISISVRMPVGNKTNNDACEGLSRFEWRFRVLVQKFVVRGDAKNVQGYLLLLTRPRPLFLLKSRGIVMFSEM